jgi:hypothetical protein
VTRQPGISFSISFLSPFNRAGGRTSNVSQKSLMKVLIAIIAGLFAGGVSLALEQPKLTQEQITELDQRDSELFGEILGPWLFESMGENLVHVAQRTIYRDDGTFVSDYRISSAGSIKYRRATGFWYPLMGWFCEEETKSTDERLIPRMVRWVEEPIDQELKTASRTGMKAVLRRGEPAAADFDFSLAGLVEKNFCSALEAKRMIGFVAEDTGEKDAAGSPLYRWILKSRLMDQAQSQKPAAKDK